MVPYAGQDRINRNPGKFEDRCRRAHLRFKNGMNTLKIAEAMNVSEATALRYVTLGRCEAMGLPIPFEGKRK